MRTVYVISCLLGGTLAAQDVTQHLYQLYNAVNHMYTATDSVRYELYNLIHTPQEMSQRNYDFYYTLYDMLTTHENPGQSSLVADDAKQDYLQQAQDMLTNQVARNPLIVFYECNAPTCILSRRLNPHFRSQFEQKVADRIVQAAQTHTASHPVQYASIGSGGLFLDLRILGLALKQKPDLTITLHLIDPQFASYILLRDHQYEQGWLARADQYDYDFPQQNLLAVPPQNSPTPPRTFGSEPASQPQYMLHILQYLYPKATITMYVYSSVAMYRDFVSGMLHLNNLKTLRVSPPDILAAADLYNGVNRHDIFTQTLQILNQSPQARALFLMKYNTQGGVASISEFALSKLNGFGTYKPDAFFNAMTREPAPRTDEKYTVYGRVENIQGSGAQTAT